MDASRGVRFWDGDGVGNGNRTRRRGLGVRLAIRASSTRSARDARRRALDASARRRTQPATRGVDGGAGAVSDATRGGYRREPGLRRGSLREQERLEAVDERGYARATLLLRREGCSRGTQPFTRGGGGCLEDVGGCARVGRADAPRNGRGHGLGNARRRRAKNEARVCPQEDDAIRRALAKRGTEDSTRGAKVPRHEGRGSRCVVPPSARDRRASLSPEAIMCHVEIFHPTFAADYSRMMR